MEISRQLESDVILLLPILRQGQTALAQSVLYPLLYGADNPPEKRVAAALFARAGSVPLAGTAGAP